MQNTITEMKNILEGINSRLNDKEEWISELEDNIEIIATEQKKEWKERHETSRAASNTLMFAL